MGIFNSIFKSSEPKEEKLLPWIALHSLEQLDYIVEKSYINTQIIFKHSTRCGISGIILNQLDKKIDLNKNNFDVHFLDVIRYREVSNEIASRFQIRHQSPQVLVIKKGVLVTHASHHAILDIGLQV